MKDIQLISFSKSPVKKLTGIYYKDGNVVERYTDGKVDSFSGVYGVSEDSKAKVFALVSGKELLAQKVIKALFTERNSDTMALDSGSSLYNMLKFYKINDVENVRVSLPVLIKSIESQIKDDQLTLSLSGMQLKNDELLDTLILENYEYDQLFGGWIISIKIVTKAGNSIKVTIP